MNRLVGRVEVLRPDRDQCRPKLRDALLAARDEFLAAWKQKKDEAHAALAESLRGPFLERLRTGATHECGTGPIDPILKNAFPNT